MSQQRHPANDGPGDQDAISAATIAAVQRWGEAVNRQDVDGVMAAVAKGARWWGTMAVSASFVAAVISAYLAAGLTT